MNHRQHYQTTHPVCEACKNIALAVTLGLIAAMLIDAWWFAS